MRVLIACEESQRVCIEFRRLGHEAYSCDILPCSGGHPEWHIMNDVINILGKNFWNQNKGWELMIAHPPCTFLSRAGARWLHPKGEINQERYKNGLEAKEFFMKLLNAPINKIVVENPIPLRIYELPEHSQIIQPFEHGHPFSKRTLLWIKNLPKLRPSNIVKCERPFLPSNTGGKKEGQRFSLAGTRDPKEASKTFQGIAKAMAEQWGGRI